MMAPLAALAWIALAGTAATSTTAPAGSPAWAEGADVLERLGARVPADLTFTNARGERIPLRALFDGEHPVLLVLAYYGCPELCSLVLDGAVRAMRALEPAGWRLGAQYRAVTISFDARERIDQAARAEATALARLGGTGPAAWPFLVGDAPSIAALTEALGFSFLRDPRTGALAHPAVVFVLTPDGAIARYLYGVEHTARDLRLALLEASEGRTGSLGDRILMRCFRYDPATRRYGLFVARFMQLGGLVVFGAVLLWLASFVRLERRRARGGGAP